MGQKKKVQKRKKERKLLTLRELVRAVDVVAPHNDHRKLEALLVRVDQHLGGGFAGGVRVGRGQDAGLEEVVIVVLDLAIDFVCGDVDEAVDADALGALEEDVGAVDVGVGEAVRVTEAQVDVGLGGEVENGVNVVALQAVEHLVGIGDVALDKGKVLAFVEGTGVVERRAVIELVEGDNVVCVGIGHGEVTDEPASTTRREISHLLAAPPVDPFSHTLAS